MKLDSVVFLSSQSSRIVTIRKFFHIEHTKTMSSTLPDMSWYGDASTKEEAYYTGDGHQSKAFLKSHTSFSVTEHTLQKPKLRKQPHSTDPLSRFLNHRSAIQADTQTWSFDRVSYSTIGHIG